MVISVPLPERQQSPVFSVIESLSYSMLTHSCMGNYTFKNLELYQPLLIHLIFS